MIVDKIASCINDCDGDISSHDSVCCMQQVVDVVHHWDAMASLVRRHVDGLLVNVPLSAHRWNVLAAFIIKRSTNTRFHDFG